MFSRVKEILLARMFMVNPRASIVESQSVPFFGARIGVAPASLGPNKRTWSEASEAETV